MPDSDVTIRECTSFDDFKQCIGLERSVWRDDDIDIMPTRLYLISKACNAPTIGAFDRSGNLVGFGHTMLALAGPTDGSSNNLAYHSHMLAVLEGFRDKDIGYRIKLAQREFAVRAGVPLVFWTFDPLQSRNAHFNINKLGAIVRRYELNYYGEGISSVFEPDVPSDRLIAEWWVSSPHVKAVLAGERARIENSAASIVIPGNIDAIRAGSVTGHLAWRLKVREDFLGGLHQGTIVRGFERDLERQESRYLLAPDEEQFHLSAYTEPSLKPGKGDK